MVFNILHSLTDTFEFYIYVYRYIFSVVYKIHLRCDSIAANNNNNIDESTQYMVGCGTIILSQQPKKKRNNKNIK